METLEQFVARHYQLAPTDKLRLGQRFVTHYGGPDVLFFADDATARELIQEHLITLQYYPHMPPENNT
jgi:hypothetical protein